LVVDFFITFATFFTAGRFADFGVGGDFFAVFFATFFPAFFGAAAFFVAAVSLDGFGLDGTERVALRRGALESLGDPPS
jgi:hypothetical protein